MNTDMISTRRRLVRRVMVALTALGLGWVLTACGDPSIGSTATRPTATASSSRPCGLLSQAEVEEAVGQSLLPGREQTDPPECMYLSRQEPEFSLILTMNPWTQVQPPASEKTTSIDGLGDEAFGAASDGVTGSTMCVREAADGFCLSIGGPSLGATEGMAALKSLAVILLDRPWAAAF